MGSLYLLLMLLIWAIGGGALSEFPVVGNFPFLIRILFFVGCILWTAFLAFFVVVLSPSETVMAAFFGLLFGITSVWIASWYTNIEFLWFNVIGCVVTVIVGYLISLTVREEI